MREILFRGKRKDGLWLYGHYADENVCETDFCCIVPLRSMDNYKDWSVRPETVGQYTGLCDKNGNKIFEGDILESRYDEQSPEDFCYEVVLWYANSWCIREDDNDPDRLDEDGVLEYSVVAGNVWDNPESVNGEKRDE